MAVHADAVVLPGGLYGVPAAHGVHAAAPDAEYVFAGHTVHDVASGLLPFQLCLQPGPLYRPAGQDSHLLQALLVVLVPSPFSQGHPARLT